MIVIAKNEKDGQNHIFFSVEKVTILDEFFNDKDVAVLSKTEEIYENGGTRSKSKTLNKDFKIELIEEYSRENEKILEEIAHKNQFVIHRDFIPEEE